MTLDDHCSRLNFKLTKRVAIAVVVATWMLSTGCGKLLDKAGPESFSLEASYYVTLPETLAILGAGISNDGAVTAWFENSDAVRAVVPGFVDTLIELGQETRPVWAQWTDGTTRFIDASSGNYMSWRDGALQDQRDLGLSAKPSRALRIGSGWIIETVGDSGTSIDYVSLNTKAHLASHRTKSALSPYVIATQRATAFLLTRELTTGIAQLDTLGRVIMQSTRVLDSALTSPEKWFVLAAVPIDHNVVITLADPHSDQRRLVTIDSIFRYVRHSTHGGALALLASSEDHRWVLGIRTIGKTELVAYRKR